MSSPAGVEEVVAALRQGLVVLVPTDTVYGLAVDPTRPGATARLFEVKARPVDVAIPVLVATADDAFALAAPDVPAVARRLAERCWPGGLTLVVERRAGLDVDLGGPDDRTIGLRVPDAALVRGLAAAVGPLAATSANLHGRPTPPTAPEVLAQLGPAAAGVAAVVDGGRCDGAPSTVVSCVGGRLTVLREGCIPARTIHEAAGVDT
jgi:L-threonylcarbamoyladenylate synthase